MDDTGTFEGVGKVLLESNTKREIHVLVSVYCQPEKSCYIFGSKADRTTIGKASDLGTVRISNNLRVVTDTAEHPVDPSLLLIQDSITHAGYCKLQLAQDGVSQYGDAEAFPDI